VTTVHAVGIDVGGTKAYGVALDAGLNRIGELRLPTPNDPDGLVDVLARIAEHLGGDGPVGLGVPGLVRRDGVLVSAPNVAGLRQSPIRELLAERLGREVRIDNDNTLAAVAEWQVGAGRGVQEMVLVGLGTGIGGGYISGGQIRRGTNGFAGEFGHMVVDPTGPECPCGRHGCWERFASGSGLAYLARLAAVKGQLRGVLQAVGHIDAIRGEHVRTAAGDGDAESLAVIDTFARWMALGLMNLTNALDPELIVISGGLSDDPELFLPPIERHFRHAVFAGEDRTLPRIAFAELGPSAGAIGAALLSLGY